MVNAVGCENCIHNKVCGKKENYAKFMQNANGINIYSGDKSIWYASDCKDVIIDVMCSYFKREMD